MIYPYDAEWAQEALDMQDTSPDETWHRATIAFEAIINGNLAMPPEPPPNHFFQTVTIPYGDAEIQAMTAIKEYMDIFGREISVEAKVRIANWFLSWAKEQVKLEREMMGI